MPYLWIFAGCYAAVLVIMFVYLMSKTASAIRGLINVGVDEAGQDEFRRTMFPKTCIVLVWSTFLTGSILGGIISGAYWLVR